MVQVHIVLLCCLVYMVAAQCNNATTTIRNHAEASAVGACPTFTGSIAIATDSAPEMEILGVQTLLGDFIAANNSGLTTFASDVVNVSGTVQFSNLISELYVQNTKIAYFQGLTLQGSQMSVVEITGNPYLQTINFGAGNVTQQIRIQDNSPSLDLTLPHLTYAYNLEISDAGKISLPVLGSISNGLEISGSAISNLSIEELSFVGGNFSLSNNPNLETLSLNKLVQVQGDMNIVANRELQDLGGLSALSSVGGALRLVGSFTSALLPSLSSVGGDVTFETTADLSCNDIAPLLRKVAQTCTASNSSSTKPPSHSRKLASGAVAGIPIGAIFGVALVVVAVVGTIWFKRRQHRRHERGFDHGCPTVVTGTTERGISESQTELADVKEWAVKEQVGIGILQSSAIRSPEGRHEFPAEYRYELEGNDRHELEDKHNFDSPPRV